ncbi:sigma-70 family RNA polymerase sigma factor [Thioclava sp. GXIMD4216]|uniref:RNA polymerase sigma factor n=1 Tax=Thioclava litoralis TaxID=3076557 RepID=A0ABZ1E192_9RHOB|nr:sigma-70 family RNA polymerase sigma factor [Thioclava sp. FTW29]
MTQADNRPETEWVALMAALAQGDRQALQRLMQRFGPGVTRFSAAMLRRPEEAEDVVQEVFLRVWQKASRYDPARAAVSTWIYRIAANHCTDRNRRLGVRHFLGLDAAPDPVDDHPPAEYDLAMRQRLGLTRAALHHLPDRQRRALLLRASGELSTREIAQIMGLSTGAVEQLLIRARARLRDQLKEIDP